MEAREFNKLLKRIKTDQSAFDRLYEYYFAKIVFHVKRRFYPSIDESLACDIANTFFLKLLRLEVEGEIEYPASWVYRCCDNLAKTELKKNPPYEDLSAVEIYTHIEETPDNGELTEFLRALEPDDRKLIYLHYWEGYSLKEIASALHSTEAAIRQRHHRLKGRLKKKLQKNSQKPVTKPTKSESDIIEV